MRRLLAITAIATASAGLLVTALVVPVGASTPLPNGSFYGQLSGPVHTPIGTCPVAAPSGATDSVCSQFKGPFTVTAKNGQKLTGTYVASLATGNADSSGLAGCTTSNEVFTFTVGKGNTFKAVQSMSDDPNRVCVTDLETAPAPNPTVIVTTMFLMKITNGAGRFKGLVGTIAEDGSLLPNLGPTGLVQPTGRANGNLQMFFGAN